MSNVAVVVSSCDHFSDLWAPFFKLFFRYWPDCPFDVYLVTNFLDYEDTRVKTIRIGDDLKWASNTKAALNLISCDYMIYLQEDYLFQSQIDTEMLIHFIKVAEQEACICLRLRPTPGATLRFGNSTDLGILEKGAEYRVSLQAAIWNVEKLSGNLLVEGESGWDMEREGTIRANESEDLYLSVFGEEIQGVHHCLPIDYFCTAVVKGKWIPRAVLLCLRHQIFPDLKVRKMHGGLTIKLLIKGIQFFYKMITLFRPNRSN